MTGKAGLCQNRSEETLKNGSLKAGRNQLSQTGNKTGIGYQIQGVGKAPISLGCDELAMGLRIDSQNRRELSRNCRMVSQRPRMHRELVANGSPKF